MTKKLIYIAVFGILAGISACSNQGAYSEDEKKNQDSTDEQRIEDKFKDLEQPAGADSGSAQPQDKPQPGANSMPQGHPVPPPAESNGEEQSTPGKQVIHTGVGTSVTIETPKGGK
jgi:hypothetical protein